MLRTAFRATSSRAWLRSSATRTAGRSLHAQAASSSTTVPRARMVLGAATALGVSAWALASQSKLNMEEPAQPAAAAPTPAIIEAKSAQFAEVVAEEVTAAAPVADEAGATQATSIEGEAAAPEGEKQEEDAGAAAFDPVTGEINWDCPCLGGMAHGPCGPQFREAFSCFVYSEQEPKGVDCVEKFKAMQDCFRAHPETYGEELDDEDGAAAGEKPTLVADEPEPEPEAEPEPPKRKWRSRYED
ncbi:Oxidoreductase [Tulasnella sp. 417]|nr:Oxidoreductase [Tulasnella sp. 417]